MTAQSIAIEARRRLGDKYKNKWDDDRVLSAISAGEHDICKFTGLYRKEAYVELKNSVSRYPLPKDCMEISRVELNDVRVNVTTRTQRDQPIRPLSDYVLVKDELNMGTFDVFPSPSDIVTESFIVEGFTTSDSSFIFDSVFGVIVDGDVVMDPVLGTLSNLETLAGTLPYNYGELCGATNDTTVTSIPSVLGVTESITLTAPVAAASLFGFVSSMSPSTLSGIYGLVADIAIKENTLRIFYKALPTRVTSLNQLLVIPDMWFESVTDYVVGTLLYDDNDAGNTARGSSMLQKYERELKRAKELSARDFNVSDEPYETGYRRI